MITIRTENYFDLLNLFSLWKTPERVSSIPFIQTSSFEWNTSSHESKVDGGDLNSYRLDYGVRKNGRIRIERFHSRDQIL